MCFLRIKAVAALGQFKDSSSWRDQMKGRGSLLLSAVRCKLPIITSVRNGLWKKKSLFLFLGKTCRVTDTTDLPCLTSALILTWESTESLVLDLCLWAISKCFHWKPEDIFNCSYKQTADCVIIILPYIVKQNAVMLIAFISFR